MMENILVLDTAFASLNKGDDIIMECVRKELAQLLSDNFELNLPTHTSPFHWYQVWRKSGRVQTYADCRLKFVGGSNILVSDLRTHFPQWNINIFNYQPLKGSILLGVGAGQGAEGNLNWYTKYIYTHLLNKEYCHSVRDERTKVYLERMGLKAINTGCVTMWMLTPGFCAQIPTEKAEKVVFTFVSPPKRNPDDQQMIDVLLKNYEEVYFWPQRINDFRYFKTFQNIDSIHILPASKEAYDEYLTNNNTDYVGTRLHGGIYAMRHKRRSIIIAMDERARAINEKNHLVCVEKGNIVGLDAKINSSFKTEVVMDFEAINRWKQQFGL